MYNKEELLDWLLDKLNLKLNMYQKIILLGTINIITLKFIHSLKKLYEENKNEK